MSASKKLSERFGEPIGKTVATVGAADNGPHGKALWNDEPKKDRQWADPTVIDESVICSECNMMGEMDGTPTCECNDGMMPENIDEVTPPGKEKMVKALKKKPGVKNPWAVAWSAYDKEHGKKPKHEGMMPTSLVEAAPDDFDNYDRTGSEDVQRHQTTPEAIKSVVTQWFDRHQGEVDNPETGNTSRLRDVVHYCIWFMIGGEGPWWTDGQVDPVGSLWQIEEHLKPEYLYSDELARELYKLIAPEEI